MMYDIKPNRLKKPEENRAKVLADNRDIWERETDIVPKNSGYTYYPGAYNGAMNKKTDINAGKPAKRPEEEIFFKEEDLREQDDDYKDEKWEKEFITFFNRENGLTEPISKKANALNGVPAKRPGVEDFFNYLGKPSFGFEDILEDYRKNNEASPGRYKYPGYEMILQKENDLPGYRPGSQNKNYINPAADPRGIAEKYYILEDYYGKPGENAYENIEKGAMNNLRSVLGEMVGRGAFLINDWFPNYKPAQKVLEKNEARIYSKMAEDYFNLAREETGEHGDKLIDMIENASIEAGYNIFGNKAGDVFKGVDAGFKKYEELINAGVPKEQALLISAAEGGFDFAVEKLLKYGTKQIGNRYLKDGVFFSHIPWSNAPIDNPDIYDTIVPIILNKKEYGHVMHELMTNITESEKLKKYIWRPIGDFIYWFRKTDEGNYEIVDRVSIK